MNFGFKLEEMKVDGAPPQVPKFGTMTSSKSKIVSCIITKIILVSFWMQGGLIVKNGCHVKGRHWSINTPIL